MTGGWVLLLSGCGLVVVAIPLTIVVVIWTGRSQWNRDSWLLLPLVIALLAVVMLIGGALSLVAMSS